MKCVLVLVGEPSKKSSGNLLLDELFGAKIIWVGDLQHRDSTLQTTFENAKSAGEQPFLVPYGGSSPTGVLGYAYALQELLEQGVKPDWIVFATSSGGTQAGLVLGAHLYKYGGKILGISVDQASSKLSSWIADLASQASSYHGKSSLFSPADILVNDAYCSPGYGVLTNREMEAINLFARTEGLLLDPVYTARAAAGLIDLAGKGFFPGNNQILFWHTGGQPALFAENYNLISGE